MNLSTNEIDEFRQKLGHRLKLVSNLFDTREKAAKAIGVSRQQLDKWWKGDVKVPLEALFILSDEAQINFVWLATGEGAMNDAPSSVHIDWDIMKKIIYYTEKRCKKIGAEISLKHKGDVYEALYRAYIEEHSEQPDSETPSFDKFDNIIDLLKRMS